MKRYLYLLPVAVSLFALSSSVALAATASSPRMLVSPSADAAATATPSSSPTATPIPLNQCAAYATQAAAQAAFNAHPVVLHNLDSDDNGIACESLPPPYDPRFAATLGPKAIVSPSASATAPVDPPAPPVTGSE